MPQLNKFNINNSTYDIGNGHAVTIAYANEHFTGTSDVNAPYVGLLLTLNFPSELDITSGTYNVAVTFKNGSTYEMSFLIMAYEYDFAVPVLIQIEQVNAASLGYKILEKGSIPQPKDYLSAEVSSGNLTIGEEQRGINTVVITYPMEDITGEDYHIDMGSQLYIPSYVMSESEYSRITPQTNTLYFVYVDEN